MNDLINLIVIDNQENYFNTIKDYIEICNYNDKINAKFECKIKNALKEISTNPNIVVILDAYISGAKSLEFLDKMNGKNLSMILVSDNPSKEIEECAINHGALAFFPKKYEPEDLDPLFELIVKQADNDVLIN